MEFFQYRTLKVAGRRAAPFGKDGGCHAVVRIRVSLRIRELTSNTAVFANSIWNLISLIFWEKKWGISNNRVVVRNRASLRISYGVVLEHGLLYEFHIKFIQSTSFGKDGGILSTRLPRFFCAVIGPTADEAKTSVSRKKLFPTH